ncbi:flavodoxin [Selenomonas sputigena]|uniref:Flavodoxin n=1 Tax=Selenomonas sputigena TaxID=69823 RepID=A0ABV3X7R2_9FIRM
MNQRRILLIGALLLAILAIAAYSLQGNFAKNTGGPRVLVAYFSRAGENYGVGYVEKGNTAILAEMIAEETGGDLFEIKTKNPYPESLKPTLDLARKEQKEGARPALDGQVRNLADYDVIFLGYPIWYSDMPMAVYSFLEQNKLEGKTIVPFSTSMSGDLSGNEKNIPLHAKGTNVLNGFSFKGKLVHDSPDAVRPAVQEWLRNVGWDVVSKGEK